MLIYKLIPRTNYSFDSDFLKNNGGVSEFGGYTVS